MTCPEVPPRTVVYGVGMEDDDDEGGDIDLDVPFSRVRRQLNPHVNCAGVVRSAGVKSPLRHHVIHTV